MKYESIHLSYEIHITLITAIYDNAKSSVNITSITNAITTPTTASTTTTTPTTTATTTSSSSTTVIYVAAVDISKQTQNIKDAILINVFYGILV